MKRFKWNIIFSVVIVFYTTFSALYTFVIPTTIRKVSGSVDYGIFDNFPDYSSDLPSENDSGSVGGDNSSSEDPAEGEQKPVETEPAKPPLYFTDDAVLTETTYSDPDIYISIETVRLNQYSTTAYVADIRLRSAKYLKTALAKDVFGRNQSDYASNIAKSKNAILAINGDNYGSRNTGYVIRNFEVYQDKVSESRDLLAINANGEFFAYKHAEITAAELKERYTWQAFSFGPTLINDGKIIVGENSEVTVSNPRGNPRTAIGMIEPLHYVFVVSDGRTSESPGLKLFELASFMQSYGVKVGYNLDGGGSSTMVFNGKVINKTTSDGKSFKERGVTDIVYIGY